MRSLLLLLLPCLLTAQNNPLTQLIQEDTFLYRISSDPAHRVQLVYTQIDRDQANIPHFTTYSYQLDTNSYFYPASTVKLPAAILALEKINQLHIRGLSAHSTMKIEAATPPQTAARQDTSKADGLPTIAHYIKKIFLVSDNDAFNRLYEFLGQEYFNRKLREKGYTRSRIIHRLSVGGFDLEGNRHTNPVGFYAGDKLLYYQGEVYSNGLPDWELQDQLQGKGYQKGKDEIVEGAFDFTHRNSVSLLDLHDILQAVIFPDAVSTERKFDLSPEDYTLLLRYMSMLPRESSEPAYPHLEKWDNYVKFILFGTDKQELPDHIRIFNKVGVAYGYLTDVAYVVDFKNKVEFLLAATIHTNANQIFNDGVYEYDTIGLPFLERLGQVIYAHELERPKRRSPNLSHLEKLRVEKN